MMTMTIPMSMITFPNSAMSAPCLYYNKVGSIFLVFLSDILRELSDKK